MDESISHARENASGITLAWFVENQGDVQPSILLWTFSTDVLSPSEKHYLHRYLYFRRYTIIPIDTPP
jgi:hypothetical protein